MERTTTYKWTTARGAQVSATITVDHQTEKTINADGFEVQVPCNEWFYRVDAMTVNGKPTELKELWTEGAQACILIGRRGKDRILAALPAEVEADVYGEERAYCKARLDKNIELEREVEAERRRILKAMNP